MSPLWRTSQESQKVQEEEGVQSIKGCEYEEESKSEPGPADGGCELGYPSACGCVVCIRSTARMNRELLGRSSFNKRTPKSERQ